MPETDDNLPMPPAALADRALAIRVGSDHDTAYQEIGKQLSDQIVEMLPADWSFEGKRVLDFGSGAGRTLRHFHDESEQAEFWATDIDEPSIAWLEQNLSPPFRTWLASEFPPLGLPLGSFDLIYAISVFTHLSDGSLPWLLELHRLLKPDGILIVTYTGRWSSEWFAREPWDEDRIGMNVLYRHREWEAGGPAVLLSDWWIDDHWGRAFEIESRVEQFHNFGWVAMRKRPVELTTDDLERPGDDPRELVALKHNIRQLQREQPAEIERALNLQAAHYETQIEALRGRVATDGGSPLRKAARRTSGSLRARLAELARRG